MNYWVITFATEKYKNTYTAKTTYDRNDGFDHLRQPVSVMPSVFTSLGQILKFIKSTEGKIENFKKGRNVPKSVLMHLRRKNNNFNIPSYGSFTWEVDGNKYFMNVSVGRNI